MVVVVVGVEVVEGSFVVVVVGVGVVVGAEGLLVSTALTVDDLMDVG